MKFCKLKVIFQTINTFKNYFLFKYFVSEAVWPTLIYAFLCGRCTASNIGNTYRHFNVKASEGKVASQIIGKPVKGNLSAPVRDHRPTCDYQVVHENFKFFGNYPKYIYWN